MSIVLKLIISLSLSGSMIAILFFLFKPLLRYRLSKTWQYYIWLVVLFRMLVPYTIQMNLVGTMLQWVEKTTVLQEDKQYSEDAKYQGQSQEEAVYQGERQDFNQEESRNEEKAWNKDETQLQSDRIDNSEDSVQGSSDITEEPSSKEQAKEILDDAFDYLSILYILVAFLLLFKKIITYRSFVRYLKAGRYLVSKSEVLESYRKACTELGVKTPIALYTNKLVSSPMLVGMYRPFIILPDVSISEQELYNIFIHELIHYKRRDIIFKWITQTTVCLHWFNPFIYHISKEINKNCELSCDELIIKKLDDNEKRKYGDTLLSSLKYRGNYGDTIISMTLSEDAKLLKERLGEIMRYSKKSKGAVLITIVLTAVVILGASVSGAYASPIQSKDSSRNTNLSELLNRVLDSVKDKESVDISDGDMEIDNDDSQKITKDTATEDKKIEDMEIDDDSNVVIDLKNQNTYNIAESGAFYIESSQTITLNISSTIKGGTVNLILQGKNGKEHIITIGSKDSSKKIKLKKGEWSYTCSGIFKEGGNLHIVGTVDGNKDNTKTDNDSSQEGAEDSTKDDGDVVMDLESRNNRIEASGSFQVEKIQTLTLKIESDIKGGTVDLFLFDPNGKEKRITIGSKNLTKKIKLSKGEWAYNCFGIFNDSGTLKITGTISN
ncbi:MAG TPA: M56 family metallopeptidase [Lachnospiraceae bacterium]|nr:M56 family metallopeptidase [Lachnospiraceae bacterium]